MSQDLDGHWAISQIFSGAVGSILGDTLAHTATVKAENFVPAAVRRIGVSVESLNEAQGAGREDVVRLPTHRTAAKPICLRVFFTDHSAKDFEVDHELTVEGLLGMISSCLHVKKIDTYGLYDVSGVGDLVCLDPATQVLAVLTEWQKPVKLGKGIFRKK